MIVQTEPIIVIHDKKNIVTKKRRFGCWGPQLPNWPTKISTTRKEQEYYIVVTFALSYLPCYVLWCRVSSLICQRALSNTLHSTWSIPTVQWIHGSCFTFVVASGEDSGFGCNACCCQTPDRVIQQNIELQIVNGKLENWIHVFPYENYNALSYLSCYVLICQRALSNTLHSTWSIPTVQWIHEKVRMDSKCKQITRSDIKMHLVNKNVLSPMKVNTIGNVCGVSFLPGSFRRTVSPDQIIAHSKNSQMFSMSLHGHRPWRRATDLPSQRQIRRFLHSWCRL